MKINYYIFYYAIILFLFSCKNKSIEGWEVKKTKEIYKNIYIEKFYKSYGVYGGDSRKYFLTDSINYRKFIGECDEKEYFDFSINGSILKVEKFSRRNAKNGKFKKIQTKFYNLPLNN